MLRAFELSMRRRNLRPGTIRARMSCVRRWLAFVDGRVPDREMVEAWLDSRDMVARSRYTQISHLHQFYIWARREGWAFDDPTELLERPRLPRRLPRPARMADVDFAIAVADQPVALMLTLMADGGLRCCEVATLDWCDVDLDRGVMMVTGKGDQDRPVGVPERLRGCLEAMPVHRGRVIGSTMSATRVSQVVNQHLHGVGLPVTAHQLRHLYATRMLTATHDITAVQQALGHSSIMSTQIYAQVDPGASLDAARHLR